MTRKDTAGAARYKVELSDGSVHYVAADVFLDPGIIPGQEYTESNTLWFDDIVWGLTDHVPDGPDIVSVVLEVGHDAAN